MRRSLERLRPLLWLGIAMVLGYGLLVHWWWTAPMLALGDQIAEVRDEELGLRMEGEQIPQLQARLAEIGASALVAELVRAGAPEAVATLAVEALAARAS